MPIRLPPGCAAAALCRPEECEGCDAANYFDRDPCGARLALSPLLRDGMAMASLRAAWLPFADDQALDRLDDQQLIDVIGAALATGRLRLCPGSVLAEGASNTETGKDPQVEAAGQRQAAPTTASAPAPAPAAPRPAPPPPAAAAPPPPAPVAPPEPEIDAAAMTAVLLSAARDGVPFCEECEKARKAREAETA